MQGLYKRRLKSYIFDVPAYSYRDTTTEHQEIEKKFLTKHSSRINISQKMNKFTGFRDKKPESRIPPNKLNFCVKFLPYIHAQDGISKSKNIVASIKNSQSNDNFPLLRKKHEVNILSHSEVLPLTHSRNRTLELVQT